MRHHHTALHVSDMERSERFYVDGLGLERLDAWTSGAYIGKLYGRADVKVTAMLLATSDGSFRLELAHAEPLLTAVDPSQAQPGTAHLAFTDIDVREVYARMMALGYGAISEPVAPTSGPIAGGWLVYLLDPDGNRVELIQPPDWRPGINS
ncbi:catechol 2,3-dioxygenase-like lactoylglutathione lyase family enzyme [Paenarthrobacter sp. TE4293]|uniref:VOC family protein n=1 Tax=Paenarthrobacter sp. TE4293 TaxID=3381695 RepID=UPI003D1B6DE0